MVAYSPHMNYNCKSKDNQWSLFFEEWNMSLREKTSCLILFKGGRSFGFNGKGRFESSKNNCCNR